MKRRMPLASSDGVTATTLNKNSLAIEDKGYITLRFIVCKSGGRFSPGSLATGLFTYGQTSRAASETVRQTTKTQKRQNHETTKYPNN